MNIKKPLALAIAAVFAVAGLAGCSGGGSVEEFCKAAEDAMDADFDNFKQQADKMRDLAKKSPDKDLASDLKYFADALSDMDGVDVNDPDAEAQFAKTHDMDRLERISDTFPDKAHDICINVDQD